MHWHDFGPHFRQSYVCFRKINKLRDDRKCARFSRTPLYFLFWEASLFTKQIAVIVKFFTDNYYQLSIEIHYNYTVKCFNRAPIVSVIKSVSLFVPIPRRFSWEKLRKWIHRRSRRSQPTKTLGPTPKGMGMSRTPRTGRGPSLASGASQPLARDLLREIQVRIEKSKFSLATTILNPLDSTQYVLGVGVIKRKGKNP